MVRATRRSIASERIDSDEETAVESNVVPTTRAKRSSAAAAVAVGAGRNDTTMASKSGGKRRKVEESSSEEEEEELVSHRRGSFRGARQVNATLTPSSSIRFCHQDHQPRDSATVAILVCTQEREGKPCGKSYCGPCITSRYGDIDPVAISNAKRAKWVCYLCRGLCNCAPCRRKSGCEPIGRFADFLETQGMTAAEVLDQEIQALESTSSASQAITKPAAHPSTSKPPPSAAPVSKSKSTPHASTSASTSASASHSHSRLSPAMIASSSKTGRVSLASIILDPKRSAKFKKSIASELVKSKTVADAVISKPVTSLISANIDVIQSVVTNGGARKEEEERRIIVDSILGGSFVQKNGDASEDVITSVAGASEMVTKPVVAKRAYKKKEKVTIPVDPSASSSHLSLADSTIAVQQNGDALGDKITSVAGPSEMVTKPVVAKRAYKKKEKVAIPVDSSASSSHHSMADSTIAVQQNGDALGDKINSVAGTSEMVTKPVVAKRAYKKKEKATIPVDSSASSSHHPVASGSLPSLSLPALESRQTVLETAAGIVAPSLLSSVPTSAIMTPAASSTHQPSPAVSLHTLPCAPSTESLADVLGIKSLPTTDSLLNRIHLREFFVRFSHLMPQLAEQGKKKGKSLLLELETLGGFWDGEVKNAMNQIVLLREALGLFAVPEEHTLFEPVVVVVQPVNEGSAEVEDAIPDVAMVIDVQTAPEGVMSYGLLQQLKRETKAVGAASTTSIASKPWLTLIEFLRSEESVWVRDDMFDGVSEGRRAATMSAEQKIMLLCGIVEIVYRSKKIRNDLAEKTDTERSTHIQLKATAKSNERAHLNSVREASLAKKGLKPVVAPSDPEFFRLLTEYGQACMAIEQEMKQAQVTYDLAYQQSRATSYLTSAIARLRSAPIGTDSAARDYYILAPNPNCPYPDLDLHTADASLTRSNKEDSMLTWSILVHGVRFVTPSSALLTAASTMLSVKGKEKLVEDQSSATQQEKEWFTVSGNEMAGLAPYLELEWVVSKDVRTATMSVEQQETSFKAKQELKAAINLFGDYCRASKAEMIATRDVKGTRAGGTWR